MTTKKGKNGSKLGNGSARSSRVEPEGPGLWRMFPIFMVVLGVVWGILWAPSDPLHDAETSKEATGESMVGNHRMRSCVLLLSWPPRVSKQKSDARKGLGMDCVERHVGTGHTEHF